MILYVFVWGITINRGIYNVNMCHANFHNVVINYYYTRPEHFFLPTNCALYILHVIYNKFAFNYCFEHYKTKALISKR